MGWIGGAYEQATPILLIEPAGGFLLDLSFAGFSNVGTHREPENELRNDFGAPERSRQAQRSEEGSRPSFCEHDRDLYCLALFAAQEPAGHFKFEGGVTEMVPALFGGGTGVVCFTGPPTAFCFTFEGGVTEEAPALFGGRTGEVCFTGPPTAFCFAGGPLTELCAKAGA